MAEKNRSVPAGFEPARVAPKDTFDVRSLDRSLCAVQP